MKVRNLLVRTSAILFILLFLYKSGGGLFVHNIYHATTSPKEAKVPGDNKEKSISCTCIDDFLVPTISTEPVQISFVSSALTPQNSFLRIYIPVTSSSITFLRGPPSSISFAI